jgi:two-component system osmolarity sensor histidine kinase EnvZ
MVAVTPATSARRQIRGVAEKGRRLLGKAGAFINAWTPKGLYTRALIIIVAPIVLLQSVLTFVFFERHWEFTTRRLSTATAQNVAMLAEAYALYPDEDKRRQLTELARENLNLVVRFVPDEALPPPRPKPFFGILDRTLSSEIRRRVARPFWIDSIGSSRHVEIRIKLDDAVMRVIAPRGQTYASNSHIFLVWMVVTSLILLAIAVLFLRNQIRPILALADAADRFGRGRPAPPDFRVRGAREVRLAAQAFLEMRDRIERHVEQRTIMLAGVSHDLRTILTRFRLQLAMLDAPEVEALRRDVDEMQQMLEDYVAFAKGDAGEPARRVDVGRLLNEIRAGLTLQGQEITVDARNAPIIVPLRRNAFKRAVMNLVSNATRYAGRISIRAMKSRRWLTITVEDDGPGIPPDKREDVFRPFHSLDDARNQNVKSTGLGLAIARDIVRGHGGEIVLDQSRLGGLKAIIRVPVTASDLAPLRNRADRAGVEGET